MEWIGFPPPVSPFTSVAPLVFVVSMTMLKQGYEDFKRHRADRVINQRKITKLENGGVIEIQAQEVLYQIKWQITNKIQKIISNIY